MGGLVGAAGEDRGRLAIRPVAHDALQKIEIGAGRQRIEEALRREG